MVTVDGDLGVYRVIYKDYGIYIFTCTAIDVDGLMDSSNMTVHVYGGKTR